MKPTDTTVETPAGGVELYRALTSLSNEYRMRAVAERDHASGAIALALEAVAIHAARSGAHIHLKFGQGRG
jgi:hypothetical protein